MAVSNFSAEELRALIAGYESDKKKLDYQTALIEKTLADLQKKLDRQDAKEKKAAAKAAKAPTRRGRKPGPKKATTGRRGRPAKAKAEESTTTESAVAAAPKKRRGRPAKAKTTSTAKTAAAPKKRRGRPAGSTNKAAATAKATTAAKTTAAKTTDTKATAKPKPKAAAKKAANKGYRLNEMDQLVMGLIESNGKAMISSQLVAGVMDAKKIGEEEAKTMLNRTLHKLANRRSDLKKVPYAGRGFAYALPAWVNAQGKAKRQYKHS